ncbi:MAG TPA: cytidylate kinase-like family protein [Bryobacteraceae bacterium]|nr:cytidylate kinase-like family protein [Bryobacteraceae bacterium]
MRVVTVGGEYGAGRAEIAQAVAEGLGWRLLDSCLIEDIARIAHLDPALCRRFDEVNDPWFHRLQKALWQGGFEGEASTTEGAPDADSVAKAAHQVILEAARQGNCVIVGRGGQCVLQQDHNAFHVFVYAPLEERAARVRKREKPHVDVYALIDNWDRRRAAYVRRHFAQDWTNRHLYDLMVCSSMGDAAAARAVLAAVEALKP